MYDAVKVLNEDEVFPKCADFSELFSGEGEEGAESRIAK